MFDFDFDFENDFTASVTYATFIVLMAVVLTVGFIQLWLASGSFFAAVFLGLLLLLFTAPILGGVITAISFLFALWLRGRRKYLNDRARAKEAKAAAKTLRTSP
ncbi:MULTISPECIES: hypothetical protein [unclassified Neisseria]|uniref:hypothetical protein n=1 Tax=unclassified Neisseria TaxID=2623750 RepID=UPI001072A570|nr:MULTISPECIES: hypothetical protein [unclassified Neisseria]MBF0802901.1 hypothetical protein [Neisseria sp. 19428wB4_WF04]TFU44436.1 hypothetical protein E4T99_00715 [Neisseria sp. WF04]